MSTLCARCGTSYLYGGQCNCINTTQQAFLSETVNPLVTTHQYYIPRQLPAGRPTRQIVSRNFDPTTNSTISTHETEQPLTFQIQRYDTDSSSALPNYTHDTSNQYYTNELADFISSPSNNSINLPLNFDHIAYIDDTNPHLVAYERRLYILNASLEQHGRVHHALEAKLISLQQRHGYLLQQHEHEQLNAKSLQNRDEDDNNDDEQPVPESLSHILASIGITQQEAYDVQLKIQILEQQRELDYKAYDQLRQKRSNTTQKHNDHTSTSTTPDPTAAAKSKPVHSGDNSVHQQPEQQQSWFSLEQYNTETQRYIIAGVTLAVSTSVFLLSKYGLPYRSTSSPQRSIVVSPLTDLSGDGLIISDETNAETINTTSSFSWFSWISAPLASLFGGFSGHEKSDSLPTSTIFGSESGLMKEKDKIFDTNGGTYRLSTGPGVVIAGESTLEEIADNVSDYVSDHLDKAM